jgi:hypothetical protein
MKVSKNGQSSVYTPTSQSRFSDYILLLFLTTYPQKFQDAALGICVDLRVFFRITQFNHIRGRFHRGVEASSLFCPSVLGVPKLHQPRKYFKYARSAFSAASCLRRS